MKRRLLVTAVALFMLLLPVFAAKAESESGDPSSIFNLIEADPFEGDDYMTKGEACYYLTRIANVDGNAGAVYFEDVGTEHPYFAYINYAFENGLFERMDNRFYPDRYITVGEFLESALKLAGYEPYIRGRSITYSQLITELKLQKDMKCAVTDKITGSNFSELLYTAVTIPLLQTPGGKGGSVTYEISNTDILIGKYREIDRYEGRIVADENIHLSGYTEAGRDQFKIDINGDVKSFSYRNILIPDIIGMKAEVFVQKDSEALLYYKPKHNDRTDITINSDEVVSIGAGMSDLRYYDDKGRSKVLRFADDTEFVYNGKNCYGVIEEYFTGDYSRIRALDFDGNNVYDIVFLENYEPIMVSSINYVNLSVKDLCYGSTYKFDEVDMLRVIVNGSQSSFSGILKNNVISIVKSLDGELVTLYVTDNVISGTLDSKGGDQVVIDGVSYHYCSDRTFDRIELGTEATFGINHYGYIACAKPGTNDMYMYGYLIKAVDASEDGEPDALLKLITEKNKYESFKMSEHFTLNGQKSDDRSLLDCLNKDQKTVHQLVKYVVDVKGDIKKLYYADTEDRRSMEDGYTGLYYNRHYPAGAEYLRGRSISMDYYIGYSTVQFVICTDDLGEVDKDRSRVYTGGFTTKKPDMKVYDAGKNRIAGAFVMTVNVSDLASYLEIMSSNYRGFLVEKNNQMITKEGETVDVLIGWQENALRQYYAPDGESFDDVKPGDVLILTEFNDKRVLHKYSKIFTLNSDSNDGIALAADKEYTKSNLAYYNKSISDRTSELVTLIGEVITMEGTLANPYMPIVIRCKGAEDSTQDMACMLNVNTTSVYVYYERTATAVPVSYTEIDYGDEVFLHCRNSIVTEIVIVK